MLLRVNEQRNILHEIRKRKANWIGPDPLSKGNYCMPQLGFSEMRYTVIKTGLIQLSELITIVIWMTVIPSDDEFKSAYNSISRSGQAH